MTSSSSSEFSSLLASKRAETRQMADAAKAANSSTEAGLRRKFIEVLSYYFQRRGEEVLGHEVTPEKATEVAEAIELALHYEAGTLFLVFEASLKGNLGSLIEGWHL